MKLKKSFLKNLRILLTALVIVTVSPVILGKLGFWESSQAAPKFEKPNSPLPAQAQPLSWPDAIARATPSVVSIHSTKEIPRDMNPMMRDPFFRYFFGDLRNQQLPPEVQSGIGSGVIVTKDGYILTNNHVIAEADEITVKLADGRSSKAKIVGADPDTDLAVLKIELNNLPVIAMGDSDALRVGDVVFAIGNPYGMAQTVTQGIISATHRTDLGINTFENFLQTDAAINPGNSGGALIDVNGNIIGINNAIYTRNGGFQGIGFAIPISLAKDIMGELIGQGHVTRGWLGISVFKLTEEARKSLNYPKGEGAVIAGIIRGGPAFNAGLKPGDIIISLNNQPTNTPSDVLSITAKLKPDTAYPISIVRNGETLDFRVVVSQRTPPKPLERSSRSGPRDPRDPRDPTDPRDFGDTRQR